MISWAEGIYTCGIIPYSEGKVQKHTHTHTHTHIWSAWKAGCPGSSWVKIPIRKKWVKVIRSFVNVSLLAYFIAFVQSISQVKGWVRSEQRISLRVCDWLTWTDCVCLAAQSWESHGSAVRAQSARQPFTHAARKWLWQWYGESQLCCFPLLSLHKASACL